MLNLGCGSRTHPEWVNIDYSLLAAFRSLPGLGAILGPLPVGYRNWDLRRGIPFDSGTVAVVYSSHVLEHINHAGAPSFLKEAARVLRPGGIIRIVVPDLEASAREYIEALNAVRRDGASSDSVARYELATLLLLDQMVRQELGGELAQWLRRHADASVVRSRGGILASIAASQPPLTGRHFVVRWLASMTGMLDPTKRGEVHRWMYDEVSLATMLRDTGFRDVARVTASTSRIDGWGAFGLDTDPDGTVHQPGSLWMEATK